MLEFDFSNENLCGDNKDKDKNKCEYNISIEKIESKIEKITNPLIQRYLYDVLIHKIEESRSSKVYKIGNYEQESYKSYINLILNIDNEKIESIFKDENMFNRFNEKDFISNEILFTKIITDYILLNTKF